MPGLPIELITPFLVPVLLISMRIGVAFALLPAPLGSVTPVRVRVLLSLSLAILLAISFQANPIYGGVGLNMHVHPALQLDTLKPLALGLVTIGEVIIGAVIGLTVRVILAAAEAAGNIAGLSMGLGFANTVDPSLGEPSSPLGRALSSLSVLIFFVLKGHHDVIAALGASIRFVPPGRGFTVLAQDNILSLGSTVMAYGLRIASPVVATMFIVQLGSAFVARAAPRVHLFVLTFTIAITAGLITLILASPSLVYAITAHIRRLPDVLFQMLTGS